MAKRRSQLKTIESDSGANNSAASNLKELKARQAGLRELLAGAVLERRKQIALLSKQRLEVRDELVTLIQKLLPQYLSSFEGKERTMAKDIRATLRAAPKELKRNRKELKKLPKGSYNYKRLLKTVSDLEKGLTSCAVKGAQLLDKVASDIHSLELKNKLSDLSKLDKQRKKDILSVKYGSQKLDDFEKDSKPLSGNPAEDLQQSIRGFASALHKLGVSSATT